MRSGHLQLHMFQRSGLWTQPIQTTEVQCIEMAAGVSELASEAAGWYKNLSGIPSQGKVFREDRGFGGMAVTMCAPGRWS